MINWMRELAQHYEQVQDENPNDKLMILFDIDGTILDMRYMVVFVLQMYDRQHATYWFTDLAIEDVVDYENNLETIFTKFNVPYGQQKVISQWYLAMCWTDPAVFASHRPFRGVLELIRWFQMQPNTYVALNTGRPESLRFETLRMLNHLGQEYRVQFSDAFLHMNHEQWQYDVRVSKAHAVREFRSAGFNIVAAIDNEPESLQAIASADKNNEILLLHADTLFGSQRSQKPDRAIGGSHYDIDFILEKPLPNHVQFVWDGINNRPKLDQFLSTAVQWARVPVCLDPFSEDVVVCDSAATLLQPLDLATCLTQLHEHGRSVCLHFGAGGVLVDKVHALLERGRFSAENLMFSGQLGPLRERDFRVLAMRYPNVSLQCEVDTLLPLLKATPAKAGEIFEALGTWGVTRLSMSARTPHKKTTLTLLEQWGFEINLENANDLESFLAAALMLPASITTDFVHQPWLANINQDNLFRTSSVHLAN